MEQPERTTACVMLTGAPDQCMCEQGLGPASASVLTFRFTYPSLSQWHASLAPSTLPTKSVSTAGVHSHAAPYPAARNFARHKHTLTLTKDKNLFGAVAESPVHGLSRQKQAHVHKDSEASVASLGSILRAWNLLQSQSGASGSGPRKLASTTSLPGE